MNDTKWTDGEAAQEPSTVDDVVVRAEDSLAEAEAAREGVGSSDLGSSDLDPAIYGVIEEHEDVVTEDASAAPVWTPDAPAAEAVESETVEAETAVWAPAAAEPAAETAVWTPSNPEGGAAAVEVAEVTEQTGDTAATRAYAPPVAEETVVVAAAPVATTPASPQPIFVQAPEAPRPRGNRAAAGAIGLLAALSFAILYLGAWLGIGLVTGDVTNSGLGTAALGALVTLQFWVPVIVFFIAFWLLGAIINRGRWGAWVILGLLVGFAGYGGHMLGQMVGAPFWSLTAREGAELVEAQLFAPLAIAAFLFARELTIWFGAWVAARGKRVTELNIEAQREYERTLEAGPKLVP